MYDNLIKIDPKNEIAKLDIEGKVIKIDIGTSSKFNPLFIQTPEEIASSNIKALTDLLESFEQEQQRDTAKYFLMIAEAQKDTLPENYYFQVVQICSQYLAG